MTKRKVECVSQMLLFYLYYNRCVLQNNNINLCLEECVVFKL